jgi:four helix bundle protein
MQNYKELRVWEKAHFFTLKVYEASKPFPKEEIYSLTNQLRRAASAIPTNIAERCGKNSQQEFAHFLNIASGSANEAECFLMLQKDLKYLVEEKLFELTANVNEIKAMLISLIGKVRNESKT